MAKLEINCCGVYFGKDGNKYDCLYVVDVSVTNPDLFKKPLPTFLLNETRPEFNSSKVYPNLYRIDSKSDLENIVVTDHIETRNVTETKEYYKSKFNPEKGRTHYTIKEFTIYNKGLVKEGDRTDNDKNFLSGVFELYVPFGCEIKEVKPKKSYYIIGDKLFIDHKEEKLIVEDNKQELPNVETEFISLIHGKDSHQMELELMVSTSEYLDNKDFPEYKDPLNKSKHDTYKEIVFSFYNNSKNPSKSLNANERTIYFNYKLYLMTFYRKLAIDILQDSLNSKPEKIKGISLGDSMEFKGSNVYLAGENFLGDLKLKYYLPFAIGVNGHRLVLGRQRKMRYPSKSPGKLDPKLAENYLKNIGTVEIPSNKQQPLPGKIKIPDYKQGNTKKQTQSRERTSAVKSTSKQPELAISVPEGTSQDELSRISRSVSAVSRLSGRKFSVLSRGKTAFRLLPSKSSGKSSAPEIVELPTKELEELTNDEEHSKPTSRKNSNGSKGKGQSPTKTSKGGSRNTSPRKSVSPKGRESSTRTSQSGSRKSSSTGSKGRGSSTRTSQSGTRTSNSRSSGTRRRSIESIDMNILTPENIKSLEGFVGKKRPNSKSIRPILRSVSRFDGEEPPDLSTVLENRRKAREQARRNKSKK